MRVVVALVTLLAVASSGCLALAIAQTKQEVTGEEDLGTRASHAHADLDGTYCFVDHHTRTTRRAHVSSWYRIGGGFNAVLFGLAAGSTDANGRIVTGAIALDGLFAFIYAVARQNKMSTDTSWEPTTETTICAQ